MTQTRWNFKEGDLIYLVNHFMPDHADVERMVRVLQDDEDILQSMIEDQTLSEALLDSPEPVVQVTPYLYFAVLLHRAREDLKTKPYTFEKDTRQMMVIFDTSQILDLLERKATMIYLARMLASFTRIHSYVVTVRVREGIWRKLRFSDFDVESLISYSEMTDEESRFPIYRRIADICLFTLGVFTDLSGTQVSASRRQRRVDPREYGPHYYRTASLHPAAEREHMRETLEELADAFDLAAKPLAFVADHYIAALKTKIFELPPE